MNRDFDEKRRRYVRRRAARSRPESHIARANRMSCHARRAGAGMSKATAWHCPTRTAMLQRDADNRNIRRNIRAIAPPLPEKSSPHWPTKTRNPKNVAASACGQ